MSTYQPVIAQPSSGGDLMTRLSPENVGGSNYVLKRDWRRVMDAEARREGHVKFAPDPDETPADQYVLPSGGEITLIHFARKPNGQTAVIVGTKTKLYRYFSFEDGGVYTSDVYSGGTYADLSGIWLEIGEDFSSSGNRWEAVDVGDKTIFNNGVDLPVVYDLGWLHVVPLYELRDQGVAFVGTIAQFNGMLICGSIAEIKDDLTLYSIMHGREVSSASQTAFTVTSTTPTFTSADVGKTIVFSAHGETAKILTVSSSTVVITDKSQNVSLAPFRVATLYGRVTDASQYSLVQYRLLCSNIGDATDFAGGALTTTLAATLSVVGLFVPTWDLNVGDEIVIPGAGTSGAALTTTIVSIDPYRDSFTIANPIVTSVTGVLVQKTSRIGSVSSSFDLQDDNSPIVRATELQGRLVVFKETAIFVGQYTGPDAIINFQKVYGGPDSLAWKWMLAKIDGKQLIYAGRNAFYTFDLSSLYPKVHDKLYLCDNIFFDNVGSLTNYNSCWAVDNSITTEIWFSFPTSSGDKALCYDYFYNTCSTITVAYSAACGVKKPAAGAQIGVAQDWFVMGTSGGFLFQYGLTDLGPGTWQRDGVNYDSVITSGLFAPPDNFDELDLRNYVIYFSGYPTTPVSVTLKGARNAHEPFSTLFTRTIASPTYKNLIPTYYRKNYYQDTVTVTGAATNAAVVRRVLEFYKLDTRSTIRNNST